MKWPWHTFGFGIPVWGQADPGCTGSLSGMGWVRGGGTEVLGWGHTGPAGPWGPRAEGKRDSWLPRQRGRGWQSPAFPPWDTWVWTCLLGRSHRAQLEGLTPFLTTTFRSSRKGRSVEFTRGPRGRFPFGICVAASWVKKSKAGGGVGWRRSGGSDGEEAWLSQRSQAGGMLGGTPPPWPLAKINHQFKIH